MNRPETTRKKPETKNKEVRPEVRPEDKAPKGKIIIEKNKEPETMQQKEAQDKKVKYSRQARYLHSHPDVNSKMVILHRIRNILIKNNLEPDYEAARNKAIELYDSGITKSKDIILHYVRKPEVKHEAAPQDKAPEDKPDVKS